jgi:hypothetical protein
MDRPLRRWLPWATLSLILACDSRTVAIDAGYIDAAEVRVDAGTADTAPDGHGDGDGGSDGGLACGDAQCTAAQHCVARLGGPRLRCSPGPEAGPCPPNTSEGCDDLVQAAAGLRCQEIRNTWGECLDLPPSCASPNKCDCYCAGEVCFQNGRHVACNYP